MVMELARPYLLLGFFNLKIKCPIDEHLLHATVDGMQLGSRALLHFISMALMISFLLPVAVRENTVCGEQVSQIRASEGHAVLDSRIEDDSGTAAKGSNESRRHHEDKDCRCPIHNSTCGHSQTYFSRTSSFFIFFPSVVSSFFEAHSQEKLDPLLSGPFQPPRV